ncbi:MAG TPA: hypothetical protein VK571_07860 [Gemmatimonadaceae bacterium]|nr:hypothetical protein [Gemmatimonadaceae bacterium]
MRIVFFAILGVALGMYYAFSGGYILSKLWEWNAVPLGYGTLSWKGFAAVILAAQLIRPSKPEGIDPDKKKPETLEVIATVIGDMAAPWLTFLVGWMVKP